MSNKLIDKLNIGEKKGPRKAMVLAAGLGRRLRPITTNVPKPLVKLAGRTLLDYTLDHLVAAGVECAVVNIHYLADKIKSEKIVSLILGGPNKYYNFDHAELVEIFNEIKEIFVSEN